MTSASFWGSEAGLAGILVSSFGAVFLVSTFLLGSRARARRERTLASLLGRRGHRTREEADPSATTQWVPESLAAAGERLASASGFSGRLDERLEQAGMPVAVGEFVALTTLAVLVGAVVGAIFMLNPIFIVFFAGLAGLVPFLWVVRVQHKRRSLMHDQLADTMSILASSLRAGYSFLQAIDTVSKEIGEPSATEFQRVVAEIRLGRPVEEALSAMATRVESDDMKWAVIAINIQRQVGGNLAEVLDTVGATVRERGYIRRQIKTLSAEGRISVGILAAIPFGLFVYISAVNPEYIEPLFTTTRGLVLLIGGAVLMTVGIWVMSRMVKIDV